MYSSHASKLSSETLLYKIEQANGRLTFRQVLELWKGAPAFRKFFCEVLSECPFRAFRWETPSVTNATLDREFEFALLNCEPLNRQVDRHAFAQHFENVRDAAQSVVTFQNLGGDAILVAPCPKAEDLDIYAHLASFLREAPAEQCDQLWNCVASRMQNRISDRPVWLSTAGMGVAWLHVRLDDRPKYYGYAPYR